MERVSSEVFLARVTEGVIEMERLNRIDEGRRWITPRGMRLGGIGGFVIYLMVTGAIGLFASVIALASTPDIILNTTHRAAQALVPLELVPLGWLLIGVYYLRWRALLVATGTLIALLAFISLSSLGFDGFFNAITPSF